MNLMTFIPCGLLALLTCLRPAAGRTNVLLPTFPDPEPLNEAVFFAFDAVAFPDRDKVTTELIQGRDPRRVLAAGPDGAHDEHWGYFTVLRIGDRLHMWVMTQTDDPWTEYICYATSDDGVEWEEPQLGLVEYKE